MNALTLAVAALATYRLTLLIAKDRVSYRPREWVVRRSGRRRHRDIQTDATGHWTCTCGDSGKTAETAIWHAQKAPLIKPGPVGYLVECTWCVPIYVAPPVVLSGLLAGDRLWWQLTAGSLAAAAAASILAFYWTPPEDHG